MRGARAVSDAEPVRLVKVPQPIPGDESHSIVLVPHHHTVISYGDDGYHRAVVAKSSRMRAAILRIRKDTMHTTEETKRRTRTDGQIKHVALLVYGRQNPRVRLDVACLLWGRGGV